MLRGTGFQPATVAPPLVGGERWQTVGCILTHLPQPERLQDDSRGQSEATPTDFVPPRSTATLKGSKKYAEHPLTGSGYSTLPKDRTNGIIDGIQQPCEFLDTPKRSASMQFTAWRYGPP